jgi:hypothetical protein
MDDDDARRVCKGLFEVRVSTCIAFVSFIAFVPLISVVSLRTSWTLRFSKFYLDLFLDNIDRDRFVYDLEIYAFRHIIKKLTELL